MALAIHADGLGKMYLITHGASRYGSLRESVSGFAARAVGKLRGHAPGPWMEPFWALQDVSFDLGHGEVLGIIGRNGAGKSTLLKILSRITEPTSGSATLHGRLGSLLEVGTGFHPELTARENIFLSGAILGMTRREVASRFESIVEFAEVERFIDTPVKRFSSGMYLRLAFGVAAHLDPEILIVDEVLAVGDAEFQRKCLGRMRDVAGSGRTVILVSHSMPAIRSLCSRALVLRDGRVKYLGDVDAAVQQYLSSASTSKAVTDLRQIRSREGTGELRLCRFWTEAAGSVSGTVRTGEACSLAVSYESADFAPKRNVAMSMIINTVTGAPVALVNTYMLKQDFSEAPAQGAIRFTIPRLPLVPGRYVVDLNLATRGGDTFADFVRSAASFDVEDGDYYGSGRSSNRLAPILIDGVWSLKPDVPEFV